jgi:hypothetical protein
VVPQQFFGGSDRDLEHFLGRLGGEKPLTDRLESFERLFAPFPDRDVPEDDNRPANPVVLVADRGGVQVVDFDALLGSRRGPGRDVLPVFRGRSQNTGQQVVDRNSHRVSLVDEHSGSRVRVDDDVGVVEDEDGVVYPFQDHLRSERFDVQELVPKQRKRDEYRFDGVKQGIETQARVELDAGLVDHPADDGESDGPGDKSRLLAVHVPRRDEKPDEESGPHEHAHVAGHDRDQKRDPLGSGRQHRKCKSVDCPDHHRFGEYVDATDRCHDCEIAQQQPATPPRQPLVPSGVGHREQQEKSHREKQQHELGGQQQVGRRGIRDGDQRGQAQSHDPRQSGAPGQRAGSRMVAVFQRDVRDAEPGHAADCQRSPYQDGNWGSHRTEVCRCL